MVKHWSIKTKMSLALAALIVLLAVTIAFFTVGTYEQEQRKILADQQFTLLTVLADEISQKLITSHDALIQVARHIPESSFGDHATLQSYIETNHALYALFHNILIYSDQGIVLAANPGVERYRGKDLSRLEYVRKTLEDGKPRVSDPFVSPVSKEPLIVMTAPIIGDDGKILGFMGGSQYFLKDNLLGNLLTATLGNTGYFYVSSKNRRVLVHPDKGNILEILDPQGSNPTYDAALKGFEGVREDTSASSGHALYGMKSLEFSDWLLTGVLPAEEAFLPIRKSRNRLILTIVSVALITAVLVWVIMQLLLSPMTLLHRHMRAYGDNPDTVGELHLQRKDEFGKLADTFNEMVANIAKSREELEATNRELLMNEAQLIESKQISESLIQSMQDGLTELDVNGVHVNVNPAFLRMTGFSKDDIIGAGPPHPYWPPEEMEVIENAFQETIEDVQTEFELLFRKKNEERFPVIVSPSILRDKQGTAIRYFATIKDITERKRIETELRTQEARFRAITENTRDITVILDEEGRYAYISPSIFKATGYVPEEIVGKTPDLFLNPDGFTHYMEARTQAMESPGDSIAIMDFSVKHKDGHWVPFEGVVTSMLDVPGVEGIVVGCRDITERRHYEDRIQQAQKMESVGNLAGGIAHDFNNILASIIGFTELALDQTVKGSDQEDNLQEVYAAGKRARDLVKQILAFARKSDEVRTPIQPAAIAQEVLQLLRATIPTTVEIIKDIECDAWIMANSTQIHQLLMNLCTNAADAMEEQGGILEVRVTEVALDGDDRATGLRPGDYAEITVSDTGVGIPPEIIGSIFEPYFTTKGLGAGSGMGLAMAHGIVESCDGRIAVDSRPGTGTRFTVFLPVTGRQSSLDEYVVEQLPTGSEHILFVDDEAPLIKMAARNLEGLGYSVATSTSSVEALALFREKPDEFDLVISDMTMPDMTGDVLATEVMSTRPNVPVILCTGYSKKITEETAAEIGIRAFVYKPIVKADLARTVRQVLDESRAGR